MKMLLTFAQKSAELLQSFITTSMVTIRQFQQETLPWTTVQTLLTKLDSKTKSSENS